MNSELNCFWWLERRKFHVVEYENPADGDRKRYHFYCGETGESLEGRMTLSTVEQALKQGLSICENCFADLPREEIRKLTQHL